MNEKMRTAAGDLAEEAIDTIFDNKLNREEARAYLTELLAEADGSDASTCEACEGRIDPGKTCYKCHRAGPPLFSIATLGGALGFVSDLKAHYERVGVTAPWSVA